MTLDSWVIGSAHLICGLQLQLLKDLLRLRLRGTHYWRGRGESGEVKDEKGIGNGERGHSVPVICILRRPRPGGGAPLTHCKYTVP